MTPPLPTIPEEAKGHSELPFRVVKEPIITSFRWHARHIDNKWYVAQEISPADPLKTKQDMALMAWACNNIEAVIERCRVAEERVKGLEWALRDSKVKVDP